MNGIKETSDGFLTVTGANYFLSSICIYMNKEFHNNSNFVDKNLLKSKLSTTTVVFFRLTKYFL